MGLPVDSEEHYLGGGVKPVITYLLIAVNTLVFTFLRASYSVLGFSSWSDVLATYGCYPADILNPSTFYRVFSSMFVHAGILHIVGNMFFLYIFGRDVEKVMGHSRYLTFYLASGIIASLFNTLSIALLPSTYLLAGEYNYSWLIPAVGASGAISGVLGAYLVLYPRSKLFTILYIFPLLMSSAFYIALWFIYQLILGLLSPFGAGIAFWAHIGGFLGGIALTPLFLNREAFESARRRAELIRRAGL